MNLKLKHEEVDTDSDCDLLEHEVERKIELEFELN